MQEDVLGQLGVYFIPLPKQIALQPGVFVPGERLAITLSNGAAEEDLRTAQELVDSLRDEQGFDAVVAAERSAQEPVIRLSRRIKPGLPAEGYHLTVTPHGVEVEGNDAPGLFWGTRTVLQAVRKGPEGPELPCMTVEDWPDIEYRAIHYDTKHHQDSYEYVQEFIRTLARYKINMLVWEWEDKLAYERHPEIGAPGAFTKAQMQALTAYARHYHIEIVPLVQGLGHVSYILKHPQHRHLREISASAWEFCPLNEGTYALLFDLWDEAMEATPGSRYLHIGSDETYELGSGEACGCKQKTEEIGPDGLMQAFVHSSVAHVESRGRRAICWWGGYRPGATAQPPPSMLVVEEEVSALQAARQTGYEGFIYAPNPGIEPLSLCYLPWVQHSMWRDDHGVVRQGSFRETAETIAAAGRCGAAVGSITTSWDDSGLHNQAWMPRFICAAEYSWSSEGPDVNRWFDRYVREYFGREARDMRELFQLLQEGALFYYDTFQRKVWHWGDIGKIHLPDFPRDQLEYNPFWCRRCGQLLHRAEEEKQRSVRALAILDDNLSRPIKHRYDLEVFRTCAELMRHNADIVLMLGQLEQEIGTASGLHFEDRQRALGHLERAQVLIEEHLADRQMVFHHLMLTWERTRLPKGCSIAQRPYIFAPDRARHFANRTPDMHYLIMDEELLDLEGYLGRLKAYLSDYRRLGDA